ncbi:MAG: MATE family efflux transporter [Candidatus Riflebacteria bacterium]|nr:MATE family efflux transporter [Candidatus Riflebacteria bacterium]
MSQTHDLETMPVSKLLIKFAIPAITGTMVTSLYNIVDRIFLGRYVGELGIAATTIAMPMMMIVMAIGMLIGFGTNSQISIKLGEKSYEEAEELLGQGLFLFVVSSLIFTTVSLIFMKPLLLIFGATENVLPYAQTYLSIVVLGTITHLISFGANSFIRGEGNPKVAMGTMIIGGIINVILDYLFIGIFGWGMAGAAWATVIGYSVSAIWVLNYYISGNSVVKLYWRNFRMRMTSTWGVLVMGSPHFIMNVIAGVQMSLFNNQLARFGGDNAISIMGVIMSFNLIWLMPIIGISQGLQPIVGYNYGARNFVRVKKALNQALLVSAIMCTLFFLFIELFPSHVFRLFVSDSNSPLVTEGASAIQRFLVLLPVVGFLIISGNYFQFTGRPRTSLVLTVVRQVFVLIPALLILPEYFGLNGVWYTMPVSDGGALILTAFYFLRERKRLKSLIAEKSLQPVEIGS